MPRELRIDYIPKASLIATRIRKEADFEKIVIEKCPSTAEGYQMISKPMFRSIYKDNKNAIAIVLRIDENLNEFEAERVRSISLNQSQPLLIVFESTIDGKLIVYWRLSGTKNLLKAIFERIEVKEKALPGQEQKIRIFSVPRSIIIDTLLIDSLKNKHNGLNFNEELEKYASKPVPPHSLSNDEGCTLLMLSAEYENDSAVDYFLHTSIDVNYSIRMHVEVDIRTNEEPMILDRIPKEPRYTAAFAACQNGDWKILLKLLENNSLYPQNFVYEETSQAVKKFVDDTYSLHHYIKSKNKRECERVIKNFPSLHYFFDTDNNSAARVALQEKQIVIYETLIKNSIFVAVHEDLNEIFSGINAKQARQIRELHRTHGKKLDGHELFTLLANTQFSMDNTNTSEYLTHIRAAYDFLLKLSEVKIIIEVITLHGKFIINPDFLRTNVQFMLARTTQRSEGMFLMTGQICFGAKDLLSSSTKFKAYGIIIHEFTHYALLIVFHNDCKPYSYGDKDAEEEFDKAVEECETNQGKEDMVKSILTNYESNTRHAELIAHVPEMEAAYANNPTKLAECKKDFKKLFDFYNNHVVTKIQEAMPFLKRLSNDDTKFIWEDLPPSLKVTCMNRPLIKFQGYNVSLYEITGSDESSILDCLNPDKIRTLINEDLIPLGGELDKVDIYIDRKLIDSSNRIIAAEKLKSTDRLVFVSDFTGTGKTTLFKSLCITFKEDDPSYWVIYIDLKQYLKVFDELKSKSVFSAQDVLIRLLELKEWDVIVFKEQFNNGKVITFWDGLDEVSPKFNEYVIQVVENYRSSRNTQWISSRPQVEDLAGRFQISAYKLLPYTAQDRIDFFTKYFKLMKWEEDKASQLIDKNETFLNSLETTRSFNNPLLVKMLASVLKKTNAKDDTPSDWYNIFNTFIDMKLCRVREKGALAQKDSEKAIIVAEFKKVHQKYALKCLFDKFFDNPDLRIPISQLNLVRRKLRLTHGEISRFGMVHIFDEDDFNFIHRTFAEFFVAQYMIDNLYNLDDNVRDEEILGRLKLFFYIVFDRDFESNIIGNIIEGFVAEEEKDPNEWDLQDEMFQLLRDNLGNISQFFVPCLKDHNFSKISITTHFFARNKQILNFIWDAFENETLFVKFAKKFENSKDVQVLMEICSKYFTAEEVKALISGRHQRGSVLFNIWLNRMEILKEDEVIKMEVDSCLDVEYFYLEEFKSDKLFEKLKLQHSFIDFFKLIEKNLTKDEIKEIFLRNSATIINKNISNLNFLKDLWKIIEKVLSKEEIAKFLSAIDFNSCLLSEALQMFNEPCMIFLLAKYKKHFKTPEIKNLIFTFERITDRSIVHIALDNPYENFIAEYINFISSIELSAEDQKKILENPHNNQPHALVYASRIKNEKTFENMKTHVQKLYTDDEIREILFKNKEHLVSNLMIHASIEVFQRASQIIVHYFTNDKLKEFITIFSKTIENDEIKDVVLRTKISIIASKLNSTYSDFFNSTREFLKSSLDVVEQNGSASTNNDLQMKVNLKEMIKKFISENEENYLDMSTYFIKNPHLSQMITEVFFQDKKLPNFTNFYSLLDNHLKTKKPLCENEERFEEIVKFHQNEAIKLMILADFSLNSEKFQTTEEEISNFGLFSFENSEFYHETFTHFFIAKYIIDNIYNSKKEISENDIKLLIEVARYERFEPAYELILSFIKIEEKKENFHESFSSLMKSKFRNVLFNSHEDLNLIVFLSKFVSKNEEILKSLWKIDENETLVIWYLSKNCANNIDVLIYLVKDLFKSEDLLKLFYGRNHSKLIVHEIYCKFRYNFSNETFWEILKFLELSHPEIISKILEIRECKNDEEIEKLIGKGLSENESFVLKLKRILFYEDNGLDEFEKCLKYLQGKNSTELKKFLIDNAQKIFTSAVIKNDEKCLISLIESYQICCNNDELKELFIENTENFKFPLVCKFAEKSNENLVKIFYNFLSKSLPSKEDQRKILSKKLEIETPLFYSLLNNDLKVFSLLKKIYFENFTKPEIQEIISSWKKRKISSNILIFYLLSSPEKNIEFLKEFVEFLTEVFEDKSEDLKSFVLAKNSNGKTILTHFTGTEFESKLELFSQITSDPEEMMEVDEAQAEVQDQGEGQDQVQDQGEGQDQVQGQNEDQVEAEVQEDLNL